MLLMPNGFKHRYALSPAIAFLMVPSRSVGMRSGSVLFPAWLVPCNHCAPGGCILGFPFALPVRTHTHSRAVFRIIVYAVPALPRILGHAALLSAR